MSSVDAPAVPYLDFGDFQVSFPPRGAQAFLAVDQLRVPQTKEPETGDVGMWLLRSKSGPSIVLPVGLPIVRNNYRVVDIAVLHHRDLLELAGYDVIFREIEQVTLGDRSTLTSHRCPQCHSEHSVGKSVTVCPFCGEGYCDDCWQFLGGRRCFSRDCHFAPCPVSGSD